MEEKKPIQYVDFLRMVQEYMSENYASALSDPDKKEQLHTYIDKYIYDSGQEVLGMTSEEVSRKLFTDMAEYSILTPYLGKDSIEEININGWNDICVTYSSGYMRKLQESFYDPGYAVDIVKRLLRNSGMVIDDSMPIAQGHLPGNTRITALKEPIVDPDRGIAASIRLLHPSKITVDQIVLKETGTQKMIDFLCMCLRYGVSFVVAGATSSGKTTLLNALLTTIPDSKRIFTIESGSRELSLVRSKKGRIVNNAVHTLSRPSISPEKNITQEDLVVASLRFDPDVVVVGEMRDTEAYSAVEASLTGHTVVSTIHANAADAAHMRLALLCQRRFPINFHTSLMQAGQAFPVVVYAHKLEDNSRKIMDISECVIQPNGDREYHTLFRYRITKNEIVNGKYHIEGVFEQPEYMSGHLKAKLTQFGVPIELLSQFVEPKTEVVKKTPKAVKESPKAVKETNPPKEAKAPKATKKKAGDSA